MELDIFLPTCFYSRLPHFSKWHKAKTKIPLLTPFPPSLQIPNPSHSEVLPNIPYNSFLFLSIIITLLQATILSPRVLQMGSHSTLAPLQRDLLKSDQVTSLLKCFPLFIIKSKLLTEACKCY